jgi:hypothetical protein
MPKYSYARAVSALEATPLGRLNRAFANYWLSLWDGDDLPLRAAFNPARARDLLPGIVILAVRPGESVHCRLAGSAIHMGLGVDITGKDWLAMTPDDQKSTRLARLGQLVEGAASRNLREGFTASGTPVCAEEVQFPFGDIAEDGARMLISHVAWRCGSLMNGSPQLRNAHHIASEFLPLPFVAA